MSRKRYCIAQNSKAMEFKVIYTQREYDRKGAKKSTTWNEADTDWVEEMGRRNSCLVHILMVKSQWQP